MGKLAEKFQNLQEWEKQNLTIWISILSVTTILMLWLLISGESSLNFSWIVFVIITKFLAGFGISLAISKLTILIIQKQEERFKGKENKENLHKLLKIIIMVLVGLFIYQGPVKLVQFIIKATNGELYEDNIIDKLLFIYGILSLLWGLYINPLWNKTFITTETITEKDVLKKGIAQTKEKLKKKILSMKKNYAEVHIQDQNSLKQELEDLRKHLAVFTMIFLGIGVLVFMPISAIFIIVWIRIYFQPSRAPKNFELYLLLASCVFIGVFSMIFPFLLVSDIYPFYNTIRGNYYWAIIAQATGMLISMMIYLKRLLKPILEEQRKENLKNLKEEHKELKKQKKDLEKQMKKEKREQ